MNTWIAKVMFMKSLLQDIRFTANALMDDGMDLEEAIEEGWKWNLPAKKRVYFLQKNTLARLTKESGDF